MNDATRQKQIRLIRRKRRIRARVIGTAERPRLAVHRSLQYIACQLIDDASGKTLAAVTEASLKGLTGTKRVRAEAVGKAIAEKAKALGITAVVFDRGGRLYHGRVQALADAARAAGLNL